MHHVLGRSTLTWLAFLRHVGGAHLKETKMSSIDSPWRNRRSRLAKPLILAVIGLIFIAGCSAPGASAPGASAPGASAAAGATVEVTLQEFSVLLDKAEVPSGSITFETTNTGPDDVHEFVVIKTDLAPGDLPVDATGTVDEAGGGMTVIGEIEDIAVGASMSVTLDLAAGKYVLICNIYTEAEDEAHYGQGMRVAFTVT